MFSKWGTVDAPKYAVLTVDVAKLDGPDGKTLFDADFPQHKAERLASLKQQYK